MIVPTAGGNKNADGTIKVYNEENALKSWKARGLTNVRMLHTADPKVANTPEFVRPLSGSQGRLVRGRPSMEHRRFVRQHAGRTRSSTRSSSAAASSAARRPAPPFKATSSSAARSQGSDADRRAGARASQRLRVPPQERDRPAHQHTKPVGRHHPADQGRPEPARHRPVGEHGDRRQGRQLRGDRRMEGGGARQHARLSAMGEAVFRAVGGRRLQHEDAEDREARHRRNSHRRTRRRRRTTDVQIRRDRPPATPAASLRAPAARGRDEGD